LIANITKGSNFTELCRYILGKPGARWIGGNMAGTTPAQLGEEARAISDRNPRVKLTTEHISLSPNQQDLPRINPLFWQHFAAELLQQLGFENHQYVLVLHTDSSYPDGTPRPHLHIAVNRVSLDGTCAPSWLDWRVCDRALEALGQRYQLTHCIHARGRSDRPIPTGQVRRVRREQADFEEGRRQVPPEVPTICRLQQHLQEALSVSETLQQVFEYLRQQNVSIGLRRDRKRGKEYATVGEQGDDAIAGISFEYEGVAFRGGQLGRYSWQDFQALYGLGEQCPVAGGEGSSALSPSQLPPLSPEFDPARLWRQFQHRSAPVVLQRVLDI
jgi:Relaxase/Mobilisation nuclease domain